MNKVIIIGIIVAIIGIGALSVLGISSDNNDKESMDEFGNEVSSDDVKTEPKQFTIGLEESVGVSGG
ncbi:MAG: hypothetical protein K5798_00030 [Nitrosopumilus sp.]|uniref:hypothetical protein n=1 Tax=Nitrosopumilus sp. TaxID=2024843 RepID=UPI002432C1D4|nr:hypothetical protein [Nitrosopumilus sp.]MCV0365638.1 hypothetical protein [Nitrosopumilus sp.]